MWNEKGSAQKGKGKWNDAVSQAKKALGLSPNEYVEDWASVVSMAKEILAEGRGDAYSDGDVRPGSANDKAILAHYLSGTPIPERSLVKAQGVRRG